MRGVSSAEEATRRMQQPDDTKKPPPHGVVVHDPSGTWWDGAIVPPPEVEAVRSRGVVVLPVAPELVRVSAVGGFFKRAWGGGWPIDSQLPAMHAPMLLYCVPGFERLHWAARVVPVSQAVRKSFEDGAPGGLRLTADTSQRGTGATSGFQSMDLTAQMFRDMGPADAAGGWTLKGEARLRLAHEQFVPLALYGAATGLRVAWAAVSQSQ